MKKIRLLSKNLINQIAAGEVLERPASAVKELIENSLDAQARKIDIFIRSGGKTEIKVIDDGFGIRTRDLSLAIQRHATSKLNNENLHQITTLGFRGEALPSIGSVSKMKIISKSKEDEIGSEIFINSGNIDFIRPSSRQIGTTVIIKDIFFSTPARLKFLKTERYETFLIKKIIQRLSLSNPRVEFNFYNNEKIVLTSHLPRLGTDEDFLKKRILDLFGEEFSENLILFNQEKDCYKFRGYIGLPTFHFSNNTNQFIFINNRSVNDKLVHSAIKVAYRDFMSYDRFPQGVIFIDVPTSEVDINVHPAKNEVRFKDSNKLRSSIISSIRSSLSIIGHRATTTNSDRALNSFLVKNEEFEFRRPIIQESKDHSNFESDIKEKETKIDEQKSGFGKPLGFAKSQFHETYIVSQTTDGIIIVDQHAAHERIVYEKLKKDFYNKTIQTQILLIPEIIDFDNTTLNLLSNYKLLLEQYGLFIEEFGRDSIVVREVPAILSGCNVKKLVRDTLNELVELGDSEIIESNINKVCSSMACHGSIRSGRKMQIDEMNNLLRKMEDTPFSGQCNHGRPTYVELKLNEIEKLFGRK